MFAALTRFLGFEYTSPVPALTSQWLGLAAYALLICYLIKDSYRAKIK